MEGSSTRSPVEAVRPLMREGTDSASGSTGEPVREVAQGGGPRQGRVPVGTVRTMYVHCTYIVPTVRTMYVHCTYSAHWGQLNLNLNFVFCHIYANCGYFVTSQL